MPATMSYNRYALLVDLSEDETEFASEITESEDMRPSGVEAQEEYEGEEATNRLDVEQEDTYDRRNGLLWPSPHQGPQAQPPPGFDEYNYLLNCVQDVLDSTIL